VRRAAERVGAGRAAISRDALALTIDVECDSDGGPTWRYAAPVAYRNIEHGLGEVLAGVLSEADAQATLLVSNVVLQHEPSVAVLRELARVELGTHLHGDFMEPERRVADPSGQRALENQCEYGAGLESAKLQGITRLFTQAVGRQPTSFRAGRWSAGAETAGLLAELGYLVDSSVTPHVHWTDAGRSVDFRDAPEQPYRPSSTNLLRPGELPIWEFPVSIIRPWWSRNPLWLRPSLSSTRVMRRVMASLNARHQEPRVFVAMLHSSELTGGTSPYSRTEREAKRIATRLRRLLANAAEKGVRFGTLSDLARERTTGSHGRRGLPSAENAVEPSQGQQ
jgi:hypothetical protein